MGMRACCCTLLVSSDERGRVEYGGGLARALWILLSPIYDVRTSTQVSTSMCSSNVQIELQINGWVSCSTSQWFPYQKCTGVPRYTLVVLVLNIQVRSNTRWAYGLGQDIFDPEFEGKIKQINWYQLIYLLRIIKYSISPCWFTCITTKDMLSSRRDWTEATTIDTRSSIHDSVWYPRVLQSNLKDAILVITSFTCRTTSYCTAYQWYQRTTRILVLAFRSPHWL